LLQLQDSQAAVDKYIKDTLSATQGHLATAQELSITRHALTDELSTLSSELDSSLNPDGRESPTLLEELESLHRNLKELKSLRTYVLVIERALRLR
jgi:RAD50-interacting protein 1